MEYQKLITNAQKSDLPDLKVIDKYLYYRADFDQRHNEISSPWKLLVPKGLRNKVIYAAHNPPNAAHGGIVFADIFTDRAWLPIFDSM